MRRSLSKPQLEVLALRALIFLEQVRGRRNYRHTCLTGAANVLAYAARASVPTLDVLVVQRAIVETGERLAQLPCVTPEALHNVAQGFEQLPDQGRLKKPLVPTPAFQGLLRTVRQGRALTRRVRRGSNAQAQPQPMLL